MLLYTHLPGSIKNSVCADLLVLPLRSLTSDILKLGSWSSIDMPLELMSTNPELLYPTCLSGNTSLSEPSPEFMLKSETVGIGSCTCISTFHFFFPYQLSDLALLRKHKFISYLQAFIFLFRCYNG